MRRRRAAHDANTAHDGNGTRGWGPFTGGQLTAIIIVVAVMVMVPVGAFAAVSGSNVFVTDATSGAHAKVTNGGALTVTGGVTATQTPPSSSFTTVSRLVGNECQQVAAAPPAGKALVVTSVTISLTGGTSTVLQINMGAAGPGVDGCDLTSAWADFVVMGKTGTQILPFPSGYAVASPHFFAVNPEGSVGDETGWVSVHGYLVPASQCTVTAPPAGCH